MARNACTGGRRDSQLSNEDYLFMLLRVPVQNPDGTPAMPTKQGIYQIRNLVNNKVYIGSTLNFLNRKAVHFSTLRSNSHDNPYLQNAFNRYKESSFVFEILEATEGLTSLQLALLEQQYIDSSCCFQREFGYNINPMAVIPPRNLEGCKKGGSRGGRYVGNMNKLNGTLVRASEAAKQWQKANPDRVKEIAQLGAKGLQQYWESDPEGRVLQLKEAQLAAKTANTKNWIVVSPDGVESKISNLREFCDAKGIDWSSMAKVAKGKRNHVKGWRCRHA